LLPIKRMTDPVLPPSGGGNSNYKNFSGENFKPPQVIINVFININN
jgi:hypothetical protein